MKLIVGCVCLCVFELIKRGFLSTRQESKHDSPLGALSIQCIQLFFSKTLFDFKKLISGPIKLKFSGKTLNAILLAPMGHIHLRGKWRPRTPRWYNAALTHTKWMGNPISPTLSSNCENRRACFCQTSPGMHVWGVIVPIRTVFVRSNRPRG